MPDVLVLGAGLNGLTTAMLLAREGHGVTVLERDAAEPADGALPDALWDAWERPGLNQFRQPHFMLPRWRAVMERELPEVVKELQAMGGARINLVGMPHITGVMASGGRTIRADLLVDATGRRSRLPGMLEALGGCRSRGRSCGRISRGRCPGGMGARCPGDEPSRRSEIIGWSWFHRLEKVGAGASTRIDPVPRPGYAGGPPGAGDAARSARPGASRLDGRRRQPGERRPRMLVDLLPDRS
jgi:hypothetical protein